MSKQKSVLAWHFVGASRRLRYGDSNTVAAGYVYEVEGPLVLCEWGLHACRSVWDAMYWAAGPHICRVLCSGEMIEEDNKTEKPSKLVATKREVLWVADASAVLHEFSLWFAEEHLRGLRAMGITPHKRLREAVAAKRGWIRGKATTRQLASAQARTWEAGRYSPTTNIGVNNSALIAAAIVRGIATPLAHEAGTRVAMVYGHRPGPMPPARQRLQQMIMALKP